MIDEARTLELFGYMSDDLGPQSNKPVVTICEECGRCRISRRQSSPIYCKNCAHGGARRAWKWTDEQRDARSKKMMGHMVSEQLRQKVSSYRQGISHNKWKKYSSESPYCEKFDNTCREHNRDKYDRRCFLCGKDESDNLMKNGKCKKLSVHHVDMNKQQGCDEHDWKLVPLCMQCHPSAHNALWQARIEYLLKYI